MIKKTETQAIDNHWTLALTRKLLPFNFIANKAARPVTFNSLKNLTDANPEILQLTSRELQTWITRNSRGNTAGMGFAQPKKAIEFYASAKVLRITRDDTVLDAAGGVFSYLPNINCRKKYLQDRTVSQEIRNTLGTSINYIESDVSEIPLPDESVDKISCHHSFEHFQGKSDSLFINETQRLLKPGGICVILPIFIANRYLEMTDTWSLQYKFDKSSRRIMDPTASLPGRTGSGNYARIYNMESFNRRVLKYINTRTSKVSLLELRIDGHTAPDLSLPEHKPVTWINKPYRMLVIQKGTTQ